MGGGARHAKARQRHETDGKKRTCARPEEAVIKADTAPTSSANSMGVRRRELSASLTRGEK